MRRALLVLALGSLFTAAVAHAQPGSPRASYTNPPFGGVALRWNHCFGEGTGTNVRNFACDTNTGFEELVGSFMLVQDMADVIGNDIVVDISTAYPFGTPLLPPSGPPLPEWWKFKNAGTCRQAALSATFLADPDNAVCQDWGQGSQVGGIAAYSIDYAGQGTARVRIAAAVPASQP